MPDASARDSPAVRSGSFITTSPVRDPPRYSPIYPGYKNSRRIVRRVMLKRGPMRFITYEEPYWVERLGT